MKNILQKTYTFFKKHYSIIILICIVTIGGYLRLSHFEERARFNADQVRDTQIIISMHSDQYIPLLGPKAGGTKFKLGPAFYYIEYLSAKVFSMTPVGIGLITPILGTLSIVLFFYFMRFYFIKNISLLLTFLYTISFYAIRYTRFAWNPNLTPFFLLLYLISLLQISDKDKKYSTPWYLIAGITAGIGMQLHTTLLILMPATFICTHAYIYVRDKKISIAKILITIAIALLFHTPMILHDIQNDGENILSFFHGTQTKTDESLNIFMRTLTTGQFFIQGNIYTLTGIEPQRNWLNVEKVVREKEIHEIIFAVISTLFFIIGTTLIFKNIKEETAVQKRNFLLLISVFTSLLFLLYFFIASELNLRFFINIFFLPFIFFGLIVQYASKMCSKKHIAQTIVAISISIICTTNIFMYKKIYDFTDLTTRESLYGGISIGEAKEIAGIIAKTPTEKKDSEKILLPFDYARSIKFFANQENTQLSSVKKHKAPTDATLFLITKNKKGYDIPKEYDQCFTHQHLQTLTRYSIFMLSKIDKECSM